MANSGNMLKPEMFVTGMLSSQVKGSQSDIVVTKSAVLCTGERSVVFVKSLNEKSISFAMRELTLGSSLGDSYIIMEGLKYWEEIVTYGAFSIDAAAQLAGKPSMMNPKGGVAMTGHDYGEMPLNSFDKTVQNSLVNLYFFCFE